MTVIYRRRGRGGRRPVEGGAGARGGSTTQRGGRRGGTLGRGQGRRSVTRSRRPRGCADRADGDAHVGGGE
jgi:hypothetical protein